VPPAVRESVLVQNILGGERASTVTAMPTPTSKWMPLRSHARRRNQILLARQRRLTHRVVSKEPWPRPTGGLVAIGKATDGDVTWRAPHSRAREERTRGVLFVDLVGSEPSFRNIVGVAPGDGRFSRRRSDAYGAGDAGPCGRLSRRPYARPRDTGRRRSGGLLGASSDEDSKKLAGAPTQADLALV
jgi:hypothetical protein